LGEFTGSLARPLNPQAIIDIIYEEGWNHLDFEATVAPPDETVMGIDWGGHSADRPRGAYTVVVIVKPIVIPGMAKKKFQIVYAKALTHNEYMKQVREISSLIKVYNCQQIVADQGYGHVQIQELQKEFGRKRRRNH